ncbi:MAG: radical SAM protein, partial [Helicobacter sp.]|nr:radical SAM protein [Helicobacter sp.]
DLKNEKSVFVINPAFDFFDIDVFCKFAMQSLKGGINIYFAPQINPDYFVKEPFWFFITSLDCVANFLVESLYLKKSINTDFRNFLHKSLRGHSISREDIPKFLTNLSQNWACFLAQDFSKDFFLKYSDVYFPHPNNVHIAISNCCNLECVMCPYHAKEYRKLQTSNFFEKNLFMQTQDFEKIAKYCGENKIFMQFGQLDEPFIHPKFFEFLDIAKDYGVENINITTNGTLLSKKNAQKIVQSNINHITFSLDAIDKESYKRIRGYDYDTTVENIQYLIDLLKTAKKKTTLGVCFILQGENAQEKSMQFLEYWLPLVDKVKFHQLSEFELDKEGSFVAKHQKQFREYKQRYACSIPWQVLFITPDLKVTFCCNSMS